MAPGPDPAPAPRVTGAARRGRRRAWRPARRRRPRPPAPRQPRPPWRARPRRRRRDRLDGVGAPGQQAHERRREQRGGRVADRPPRAVGELPDRAGADAEVGRDPLVALAVERVADDHLPLLRRQRADRSDHAPEPLAPLHHLVGALDAVEALGQAIEPGLRVARDVERRVAGHAVQPRPQRAPARAPSSRESAA